MYQISYRDTYATHNLTAYFLFFFLFSVHVQGGGFFPPICLVFFLFELSTHGQRPKPEPAKSTSEEQKYLLCVARYFGIYYDVDSPRPCVSVLALWLQSWTNCCHSDSVKVRLPLVTHQWLSKVPHRFSVMHFLYGNSPAPWNEKYIHETSVPREAQGAQRWAEERGCKLAVAALTRTGTALASGGAGAEIGLAILSGGKKGITAWPFSVPRVVWWEEVWGIIPSRASRSAQTNPPPHQAFVLQKHPDAVQDLGTWPRACKAKGTAIFCMCMHTSVLSGRPG